MLRNGPAIKPSINGIIAEEIMKEVNKKSAFLNLFRKAESRVSSPLITKEIIRAKGREIITGIVENFVSNIAAKNPPA